MRMVTKGGFCVCFSHPGIETVGRWHCQVASLECYQSTPSVHKLNISTCSIVEGEQHFTILPRVPGPQFSPQSSLPMSSPDCLWATLGNLLYPSCCWTSLFRTSQSIRYSWKRPLNWGSPGTPRAGSQKGTWSELLLCRLKVFPQLSKNS